MKQLSSLLFVVIAACILLLVAAAASCTSTQENILQGALESANRRIDEAYITASHIVFTGKVIDANGMWLDNYLVILYLNGEEISRDVSRLQKFSESEIGVHNGLFKIEVSNVYELSAEDQFVLPDGPTMTMSNSEGFVGNTATVYKWFGDLQPGQLMRIQVPKKQIEYALYISPTAIGSLDAEIQYGKTQLSAAGDVTAYVYADGLNSALATSAPVPKPAATSVPDRRSQAPLAKENQVTWTHPLTGFFGNRWEVWERYVMGRVPGLRWQEFKEQVLIYNPHLVDDGFVFYPGKSYLLPLTSSP